MILDGKGSAKVSLSRKAFRPRDADSCFYAPFLTSEHFGISDRIIDDRCRTGRRAAPHRRATLPI
jgi:hypothetical protein